MSIVPRNNGYSVRYPGYPRRYIRVLTLFSPCWIYTEKIAVAILKVPARTVIRGYTVAAIFSVYPARRKKR